MKKSIFIMAATLLLTAVSCATTMNSANNQVGTDPWELEYITGPRIAFEGLYPDKKPMITFDAAGKTVRGNSGCNGYSTTYTMSGNKISFGEPGISTMMYCGDGEVVFRNTMKEINRYQIDAEGKLNLMMNDVVMMRFKKSVAP